MKYLTVEEVTFENAEKPDIDSYYNKGFVAGRKDSFYFYQTRSLRVDLGKFSLNSENRRVLRKLDLETNLKSLPYIDEDPPRWQLQKHMKDFYLSKFNDVDFSANKIRKILKRETFFNNILAYSLDGSEVGWTVVLQVTNTFMHYCYPFYRLDIDTKNLGMAMMISAILKAKSDGVQYVYLGGVTRSSDKYKLQFEGLEWYDLETGKWMTDLEKLKILIK